MPVKRIFVIDDSVVQCEYALDLCRRVRSDVNLDFCHNGAEALKKLRRERADVVLIDLEMPVMDGVEFIGYLAKEELAKAVIILSGKHPSLIASVGVMAEAEGLEVLGCLQKPITEKLLNQCLEHFGSSQQAATAVQAHKFSGQDLADGINGRQFLLHYQPKITVSGLILKGVEGLARWQHPQHGLLAAGHFIGHAEKKHYIDALTVNLFDLALEQKKLWAERGFNLGVSFNLSPLSLHNTSFTDWIFDHVQVYGVPPEQITFEITENILLGDLAKSIQTLARLRLRGFNISIDDYGTGFANAEQLSRIPATELKLDRSMVNGAAKKTQQAKILESTVKLATDLDLLTVAEGVETQEDFVLLRDFGVDQVQGYLFARPMAAEKLIDWMTSDLKTLRAQLMN
jgi:EAL domain-containing protein (putative c-di-GMP-specific phosphodiesterase class I)/ActR/RegA family two-component response regulator